MKNKNLRVSLVSLVILLMVIIIIFSHIHPSIEVEEKSKSQPEPSYINIDSIESNIIKNGNLNGDGYEISAPNVDCDYLNFRGLGQSRSIPRNTNPDDSWPMLKNSQDRIGSSNTSIPGSASANILWSNQTSPSFASPVVAYGKVYMATGNGCIYCFEETTGTLRWKTRLTPNNYAAVSTPAINAGHLIVYCSGTGKVYRLNAYNGEVNWNFTLPGKKTTLNVSYIDHPILIYNGKVFFGAPNKYFYCLNENTGKLIWRYITEDGLTYNYGIAGGAAAKDNTIFFGANDGYLYAMDIDGFLDNENDGSWVLENDQSSIDGDVLWKFYTGDSICSTPVVFNNYTYITVGVYDSSLVDYKIYKIFCVDHKTGLKVWEFKAEDHIVSSPAISENRVYFGSLDGKIYCLSTDSNTSYWTPYSTNSKIWSSPAVSIKGNKLVIGSKNGKLFCLYSDNGILLWQKSLDSSISSSPAIANDRIFINSEAGTLYCIGSADKIPPQIISTLPTTNEKNVPVSSYIYITFNEPLSLSSISTKNVLIQNNKGKSIPVNIEYDDPTCTLIIKPKCYLNLTTNYTVTLYSKITDSAGNRLDGNKNGNSDGSPNDDYIWSFTTSDNTPPELTDADVSPTSGSLGTSFEFSVLYTDIDNDPPLGKSGLDIWLFMDNYTKGTRMALDTSPAIPAIWNDRKYSNGEQYKLTKKIMVEGVHSYRIWCSDGSDWNESLIKHKPVIFGSPVLKLIPDQHFKEDENYVLNLSGYLSDPDTPLDQLTISVNSSYAQVNGYRIQFLYPNSFNYPSGRKFELINITVSDNDFFTFTNVKIWVEAVNDPPIITKIPNQIAIENIEDWFPISEYILDDDNEYDELNITLDSKFASIQGRYLVWNFPTGGKSHNIVLNASDGELWSTRGINIKVVSSEVSFVIRDIPNLLAIEDIELELDLVDYLIIIKGSKSNLELDISSRYALVDNLSIIFIYPDSFNYPVPQYSEEVTITVTDTVLKYTQTATVLINVTAVNDAPILSKGSVDPQFGNISNKFTFKVYYHDLDGSEKVNVYVVIDENEISLIKTGGDKRLFPGAEYSISRFIDIGYHYYYFICDDGTGTPNSQYSTPESKFFVTGNLGAYIGGEPGFNESDMDSDGIPDTWEISHGLDPTNQSDALADFDMDEFNNLLEYFGHDGLPGGNDSTDPNNATDKPKIELLPISDKEFKYDTWQLFLAIIVVVIIVIVLISQLFVVRGVTKTVKLPKKPSVKPEASEGELTEGEDIGEEIEPEGMVEEGEPLEGEVPVTEVDLTDEDKPFLESDELEEEKVMDEAKAEAKEEKTLKTKSKKKVVKKKK